MAIGRTVVFLVIAVGGLALAGYGWTTYQNQHSDVKQAVTVEGTVEGTDVTFIEIDSATDQSGSSYYKAVVRYTYTYEGRTYTSESVYPGAEKQIESEAEAREITTRYSPGQTVTVYVNQEAPSRAYLVEEKTLFSPFVTMGIGALVAVPFLLAAGKEIVRGAGGD